jgi:hypothetical protein
MTFSTRERIVRILLAAIAIWPIIHIFVVQRTGLTPWKGCGWAMYCRTGSRVAVNITPYNRQKSKIENVQYSTATILAIDRYIKAAGIWASPLPPDDLAHRVFADNAEAAQVAIEIRINSIDVSSANMFERYRSDFQYQRAPLQ